ncbi:MAG: DUF4920 domain-containing protein [Proteobacteria bacterium]|nr:DUF4920 domain-containing protein [Pseudomonadota bacterium]MCP4916502.1 DUF4920 domain-containing protein [Pseudomonadota bacterium]
MFLSLILACGSEPETVAEAPVEAPAEEVVEAPAEDPMAHAPATEIHYGTAFSTEEILAAKDLLADPAPYMDKTVRVEGRVAEVCQKAGCWMVLTDETASMRVLMKDHGFAIAKDSAGRITQVEGIVKGTEVDPEFVEHLKSESENPEAMPEIGKSFVYQLEATGVTLLAADS